jgi:hypothetical protein
MHLDFLNDLLFQYGLYAVFILVVLEGDITLLLAGVLAHSGFFGEYSFAQVLFGERWLVVSATTSLTLPVVVSVRALENFVFTGQLNPDCKR